MPAQTQHAALHHMLLRMCHHRNRSGDIEAPQQGPCAYLFDDDRGGMQDASIPVAALDALHSQPATHHVQWVGGAHA